SRFGCVPIGPGRFPSGQVQPAGGTRCPASVPGCAEVLSGNGCGVSAAGNRIASIVAFGFGRGWEEGTMNKSRAIAFTVSLASILAGLASQGCGKKDREP